MNLAQTQAEWTRLFRELGLFLSSIKDLRERARRFDPTRNRIQIYEESSVNAFTSSWTLSGVNIGTNTDEYGRLFVRITDENPSAAHALVELYKAAGAGGSDKVATGSAADGGTVTLAAANSSGLTGTVVIGSVSASETDDKHRLRVFPDWLVRARSVFDGTKTEHGTLFAAFLSASIQAQAQVESAISTMEQALEIFFATRWSNFLGSTATSPVSGDTSTDQGAVSTIFTGTLEDGRSAMVDDTTAGAQKVVKNVVSAASPVADAHNQGAGTLSTPTMNEWALSGTLMLKCVDATVGSEQFEVSQRVSTTNQVLQARNRLQVKRAFADPLIGISAMTLTRSLTLAAGSTNDFGSVSSWVINGETATNTSGGSIFLKVTVNPSSGTQWKISGYSDAARTSQVFDSTYGATGATVTVSASNGSGITGSAVIGAAPTTLNTGTLSLNCFVTQNSGGPGVPDKYTCIITRSSSGEFQDRLAELYRYALNSATSGSETLSEGLVVAGTFPPYSVRDV